MRQRRQPAAKDHPSHLSLQQQEKEVVRAAEDASQTAARSNVDLAFSATSGVVVLVWGKGLLFQTHAICKTLTWYCLWPTRSEEGLASCSTMKVPRAPQSTRRRLFAQRVGHRHKGCT